METNVLSLAELLVFSHCIKLLLERWARSWSAYVLLCLSTISSTPRSGRDESCSTGAKHSRRSREEPAVGWGGNHQPPSKRGLEDRGTA